MNWNEKRRRPQRGHKRLHALSHEYTHITELKACYSKSYEAHYYAKLYVSMCGGLVAVVVFILASGVFLTNFHLFSFVCGMHCYRPPLSKNDLKIHVSFMFDLPTVDTITMGLIFKDIRNATFIFYFGICQANVDTYNTSFTLFVDNLQKLSFIRFCTQCPVQLFPTLYRNNHHIKLTMWHKFQSIGLSRDLLDNNKYDSI